MSPSWHFLPSLATLSNQDKEIHRGDLVCFGEQDQVMAYTTKQTNPWKTLEEKKEARRSASNKGMKSYAGVLM